MVYSDLIFILGLFPIVTILSFFDRSTEYKNLILILASVIFFSWGKPFAFCLIFLSVFFDWAMGCAIKKQEGKRPVQAFFLVLDFIVNAGLLFVFGHNYLFVNSDLLSFEQTVIPVGIAFYTLRGFSYVYDIYKGKAEPEKNVLCLLTYMISFHLMLVGPLIRYKDIEPQIRKREITTAKLNAGLVKIFTGFAKVVLLADLFSRIKLAGLNGNEITTLGCWLGMMSFFAQYYFIFTGFSDIAKGLGLVNGFDYPENYFIVKADELFTGLVRSVNTTVVDFFAEVFGINKDNKDNHSKAYVAVMAIVCGIVVSLWYEAKFNFVIVGLFAGLLIALEKVFLSKPLGKLPVWLKYVYLIAAAMVIFGGLYFDSFYGYKKWLFALVGVNTKYTLGVAVKDAVLKNITLIVIAFCIICPFMNRLIKNAVTSFEEKSEKCYGISRITKTVLTAFVFALSIITLVVEYTGV